jgi:hypothetical protein
VKPLIIDEEAELELAGSVAFYEERRHARQTLDRGIRPREAKARMLD